MSEDSPGPALNRRSVLATLGSLGGSALAGCVAPGSSASPLREFAFEEVSSSLGFEYTPRTDWIGNGHSGVYVNDFDDDLWPDVLAVGGEEPVLFENDGGTFRRSDALPHVDRQVIGALFFDHDNSGQEDLLLLAERDTPLFLENQGGEFVARDLGFEDELAHPVGATVADYDRDGRLEVFVYQYGDWSETVPAGYLNRGKVTDDNGFPNYLYAYDGTGYRRVEDAGVGGTHWSLAASFVDLTGDGWPDIHVANDFNNDVLYLNRGDGAFDRRRLGAVTDRNGMSSEVADFNRDGRPDLFVTNIDLPIQQQSLTEQQYRLVRDRVMFLLGKRIQGNNLLINQGDGEFTDRAKAYGVQEGGWGWAALLTDFDNDTNPDLFHTTSIFFRIDRESPHYTYPMIWQGRGPGEPFFQHDASEVGFLETSGRGAAALDVNLDGRQDIAVATFNEDYVLYQNRIDAGNSLQLRPASGTRDYPSLGAEVAVTADGIRQRRLFHAMVDYQSQESRFLHFGLGDAATADRLAVTWPSGDTLTLRDVAANRRLVVTPDGVQRSRRLG